MRARTMLRPWVLLATFAAAVLLVMAPLGSALAVHHLFGAADHDGHQHSKFDLCQWVQCHGTSSPALPPFDLDEPWRHASRKAVPALVLVVNHDLIFSSSPRGPPLS